RAVRPRPRERATGGRGRRGAPAPPPRRAVTEQLRLGTRGSSLALAQAELVAAALGGAESVPVRSSDGEPGDKARFVRGVERALLDGGVELGVHSAKDLPGDLPDGLALVGVPAREDPRDAFVGSAASLGEL